ncbi:unnamed protein product [Hapterophycus canaliculatus]
MSVSASIECRNHDPLFLPFLSRVAGAGIFFVSSCVSRLVVSCRVELFLAGGSGGGGVLLFKTGSFRGLILVHRRDGPADWVAARRLSRQTLAACSSSLCSAHLG